LDWLKIKAEYIAGGISYRKLAEKHGVSFSQLKDVAVKEKWRELKEQAAEKATTKFVDKEASRAAERLSRIVAASDSLLEAIETTINGYIAGEIMLSGKDIKSLSSAIKDIKDVQNIKHPLDVEEQQARIANLRRQAEREDEDREILITIAPEVAEFAE
jgi:uncharacterized protein YjcR